LPWLKRLAGAWGWIICAALFVGGAARTTEAETERRVKIEKLVTAELVNIAAGSISAVDFISAAVTNSGAMGRNDLARFIPRGMPFTSAMGTELLLLSERQLDCLITLEANLRETRRQMQEFPSEPLHHFIPATNLLGSLAHDMEVLAETFEVLAPTRQFKVGRYSGPANGVLRHVAEQARTNAQGGR